MGNTHSVESIQHSESYPETSSKRSPHKLSKPRVGNHASPAPPTQAAGLLGSNARIASSSLPPSRSNSHLLPSTHSREPSSSNETPISAASAAQSAAAVPSEPSSKPESPVKEWKRRASLFRSKSTQDSRRKTKRRESMVPSLEAGDRMSRASSMTWESQQAMEQKAMDHSRQLQIDSWHTPGNRQSINYNLMSYESRRLLNLSEDPANYEDNSVMSESKFEVSRNTWKSSNPHQLPAVAQITRANSDVSLYAPVRRRSMVQTPGLATRRMPVDYSASRRSSFRHSLPATPAAGRSRMNSIESAIYPVPPLTFVAEPEALPELLPPPIHEPIERALTPSDMDYRPLGAMKFGSLRITNGAASPLPSPDLEPPPVPQAMTEYHEHFVREIELASSESQGKDGEITILVAQPGAAAEGTNTAKASLGRMQLETLRLSSPLSPDLKVASKHTATEDDLFEEDVQMEYSVEVLSVRNDPNAKPSLERLQADQSDKNSLSVARADSGIVTSPTTEYKPLSKADSGYSSNVSLRSFHAKKHAAGKDQLLRTASEESGDGDSDASLSPTAGVSIGSLTASPINVITIPTDAAGSAFSTPPPLPPKDDYLASAATDTMAVTSPKHFFSLSAAHAFRRDRKISPTIDTFQIAENGLESSESAQSSSGGGPGKPSSTLTIGSGSHRAGKLHRLLSGSGMRGPPAVHSTHPAAEAVPSVPQNVEAKLEERSGRFPVSSKRLTLRTRASKDTLKTIFSVGSFDASQTEDRRDPSPVADRKAVARKPVAEAVDSAEKPKTPRRFSFQIAQAAASVMPRRSIHRKPVASIKESGFIGEASTDDIYNGFESSITAIDNVGEGVGKSAFDQAFMAMPDNDDTRVPADRTFTMTAQMERNMGMHTRLHGQMPSMNSDLLPSPNSQCFSETSGKKKTSPPVSLHTRSGKTPRKPVPPRPQSASSSEQGPTRRKPLSRQTSREAIHSYPSASPGTLDDALAVPPIPPMSPRRYTMLEQQCAMRRQAAEDKWRPTNYQVPDVAHQYPRPALRSLSTGFPAPYQQPKLRHRASYDSYAQQQAGPVARTHQSYGQAASQSGSYYQQQLLNVQQQQWEQEGHPPDAAQSNLIRSRSRSRSVHANGNPPYRVLHSYNSPAYRNAPIWG